VYVCGAVRNAGVYRLAQGSRVVDAVSRAGGLAKDADAEMINLATPLSDGMKVDVPRKGAHAASMGDAAWSSDIAGEDTGVEIASPALGSHHRRSSRRPSGRSGTHKLQPGQSIDINTATASELAQLPGVGPSLARRILEYREANGPFQAIDDLENVSGVGPSKLAKMEPFIKL
jgi:competence protein ComEA